VPKEALCLTRLHVVAQLKLRKARPAGGC